MTTAKNSPLNTTPILTFRMADQHYALLVEDVLEVMAMVTLTRTPDAPPEVLGFANRHGEMMPVLDLRRMFGHPAAAVDSSTLFIVVQSGGKKAGLVVDEVYQVEYVDLNRLEILMGAGRYIRGIMGYDDYLLQFIAVPPLFSVFAPDGIVNQAGPYGK